MFRYLKWAKVRISVGKDMYVICKVCRTSRVRHPKPREPVCLFYRGPGSFGGSGKGPVK